MSEEPSPGPGMNINTVLTIPLVKVGAAAAVLLTGGWIAKDYANGITQSVVEVGREVSNLRAELKTELERRTFDRWTRTDQKLWAYELQNVNAGKITIPPMATSTAGSP